MATINEINNIINELNEHVLSSDEKFVCANIKNDGTKFLNYKLDDFMNVGYDSEDIIDDLSDFYVYFYLKDQLKVTDYKEFPKFQEFINIDIGIERKEILMQMADKAINNFIEEISALSVKRWGDDFAITKNEISSDFYEKLVDLLLKDSILELRHLVNHAVDNIL